MESATEPLNVRYSWRIKLFYGLIGINNLFWGILTYTSKPWNEWIGFGFLVLGGICLAAAIWVWYTPYLSVQKESLIQPGWNTKRIPLKDLESIRHFAGDLIFECGNTRIKLNKYTARKKDLKILTDYLANKAQIPDAEEV